MTNPDLYGLLGVAPSATGDEIKSAFRSAARRFHPDANPDPAAADEFKLIADAYALLSDAAQRRAYDSAIASAGSEPLLISQVSVSREVLPVRSEPQVLYALAEIRPALVTTLPDPPVNLCIVVDRSTSMQGARLDQVKASVWQVIEALRDTDTLSVVTFSDKAEVIVPAERGLSERSVAKAKVSTINAQGGTEILQGLMCGLNEIHRRLSPAVVNHLILLTDGRTYGDEEECLILATLAASDGIVISGLGIGEEWNDKFLDELTGRTGGVAAYIRSPKHVNEIINNRARGLGAAYAERLSLHVTLDTEMKLDSAFRVSPDPGPVPVTDGLLRLGSLPREQSVVVLLRFMLPPLAQPENKKYVARLAFTADVISLGRRGERATADVALPVAADPLPVAPPTALIDALSRLSQYRLQERATREAGEGDIASATRHLEILGTRLLATGQTDLAKIALGQARQLEDSRSISEEAKKSLKYGTRALLLTAGTGRIR